jgi:hypothetical protein
VRSWRPCFGRTCLAASTLEGGITNFGRTVLLDLDGDVHSEACWELAEVPSSDCLGYDINNKAQNTSWWGSS